MNSYEFLKFLTVKLTANEHGDEKSLLCRATGFYLTFNDKHVIVTAKHFADSTEPKITIPAHYKESDAVVTVPVTACVEWVMSEEYDIAYCDIKPFEKKFKEITGKDMFYTSLSEKNIMSKDEFSELNILSEILAIGYPLGESSTHHQFPLFKKGYISSLPADFTEDDEGYLYLCAEHGMSGSPVLLNNSQLKLVGVLVQYIKDEVDKCNSTTVYVSGDKILEIDKKI